MNEALIQNAEHDIHRNERGQNQQAFVRERTLKRSGSALVVRDHAAGQIRFRDDFVDRVERFAERRSGSEIERNRYRRELTLVVDRKRFAAWLKMCEGTQRNRIGRPCRCAARRAAASSAAACTFTSRRARACARSSTGCGVRAR